MLWPREAKKDGHWHRGVVDAADRFMARWYRGEAEKSWQRLTAEDAKSSNQGKPGERRGGGAAVLIQLLLHQMNAEMKWLIVWQGTSWTN